MAREVNTYGILPVVRECGISHAYRDFLAGEILEKFYVPLW